MIRSSISLPAPLGRSARSSMPRSASRSSTCTRSCRPKLRWILSTTGWVGFRDRSGSPRPSASRAAGRRVRTDCGRAGCRGTDRLVDIEARLPSCRRFLGRKIASGVGAIPTQFSTRTARLGGAVPGIAASEVPSMERDREQRRADHRAPTPSPPRRGGARPGGEVEQRPIASGSSTPGGVDHARRARHARDDQRFRLDGEDVLPARLRMASLVTRCRRPAPRAAHQQPADQRRRPRPAPTPSGAKPATVTPSIQFSQTAEVKVHADDSFMNGSHTGPGCPRRHR